MRIGYSFWGFLGEGIVDTPDGGRGHRITWLRELARHGHSLIMLQTNRDLLEAADGAPEQEFVWACEGFPEIDLLFLEWRWPIPGRNVGSECGGFGHTCDLHRQQDLLDHYTHGLRTPTLIWDKDLRIDLAAEIRELENVRIAETAWFPRAGAIRLQIPISIQALDAARTDFSVADPGERDLSILYVGNQYDRDARFNEFFATPVRDEVRHAVIGKWTATSDWPWVRFLGRQSFSASMAAYLEARATIALLPHRYELVGQTTQRIAEAVTRGCVALVPESIRGAERCTPPELLVRTSADVSARLVALESLTPEAYGDLRLRCIDLLTPLRVDFQYQSLVESCEWFSS